MRPSVLDYLATVAEDDGYHIYWPEMHVAAIHQPDDIIAVYQAAGALVAHDGIREQITRTLFSLLRVYRGHDPDSGDTDPHLAELRSLLHAAVSLDQQRPALLRHLRHTVQQCDAFDTCADHAKLCTPECQQRHPLHTHHEPAVTA